MWWVMLRYCDVSDKRTSNICPSVNPALRATSGPTPPTYKVGGVYSLLSHARCGDSCTSLHASVSTQKES